MLTNLSRARFTTRPQKLSRIDQTRPLIRVAIGLAVCLGFTLMYCADARAVLLLQYNFDDQNDPTANSGSLGAAYNGDLQGNATFAPFGAGYALSLDGATANNSVVIPLGSESAFDIGNAPFSLFARFQTTFSTSGNQNRGLIWKQALGSASSYGMGVKQDTGLGFFYVADGSLSAAVGSLLPLNDGQTHELLGVRESDHLCLYVDGVFQNATMLPIGFGSTNNDRPLVIGGRTIGSAMDDWQGLIDEIRVYDEAIATCVPESAAAFRFVAIGCLLVAATHGWRKRRVDS